MYDLFQRWLPPFNTSLIVASGVCLLLGYFFIRRRQIRRHRRAMLSATVLAGLFLVVYVTRAALFPTVVFAGQGAMRALYLAILGSHTILAIAVGPLALLTLRRALRADYARHRRVARITLPIWLYVAVTGWIVYYLLHSLA